MKRLTLKKLESLNACGSGIEYYKDQGTTSLKEICEGLIRDNELDNLIWLLPRMMTHKDRIRFTVYSAEQVIHIFEEKHPGDDRPRKAIEAAKACIERNTKENRTAARAASDAAYAADAAAYAAYAARAATYAADAAYAAYAADATYAARAAARAARAADARQQMKLKIAEYGMELLLTNER